MSNGKGSRPRPLSIPYEELVKRYDAIFKKDQEKEDNNPQPKQGETNEIQHSN